MPSVIVISCKENKNFTLFLCGLILSFIHFDSFAFQTSDRDSLLQKEYTYLKTMVFENAKDSSKAFKYAQSYLLKARKDNDTVKIVNGLYYLSGIIKDEKITEKYVDSMILLSEKLDTKFYPALAYFNKAKIEYNKGNFKKSLDLHIKTNEKAKEFGNTHLFYASKKSIGILKSRIGEYNRALAELKECYTYYSTRKNDKPTTYVSTLTALSEAYNLNKKLDSASIINKLGYQEATYFNLENLKYYFTLNEGINLFDKNNFIAAKDSLSIAIEKLKINDDKANLSMAYFYYGKTLGALKNEHEAIAAHIKVDDIFREIAEIMPYNRENYEILINYYKKTGDKDNQLKYIEQLIKVDSVLNTNYKYLIKKVIQDYDTPKLLLEKQEIIESLEIEKKRSRTIILILGFISIVLFTLWIINRERQKKFRQRFEVLFHKKNLENKNQEKSASHQERPKLNIPEESITEILNKLKRFENHLEYTKSNLSIHMVAKRFGTNSKYLSKIINMYKQKPFNRYINDLRIDHTITKLKTDSKFRNYTIKAIAKEIGFNTTDAFSKAFYKRNGIHPSYFIKELEKQCKQTP